MKRFTENLEDEHNIRKPIEHKQSSDELRKHKNQTTRRAHITEEI
jgi:hypothetical protein